MVVDPSYVRPLPTRHELWIWRAQECACFAVIWGSAIIFYRQMVPGPERFVMQGYLTAVAVLLINQLRTLGAHRYTNDGEEMSFVNQMLDSVNYPHGGFLTALWAPVGLRYHALHHLFPSMPYHNLDEAHRRLMSVLTPDNPYRRTNCDSLFAAFAELWRKARASSEAPRAGSRNELSLETMQCQSH